MNLRLLNSLYPTPMSTPVSLDLMPLFFIPKKSSPPIFLEKSRRPLPIVQARVPLILTPPYGVHGPFPDNLILPFNINLDM